MKGALTTALYVIGFFTLWALALTALGLFARLVWNGFMLGWNLL